MTKVINGTDHGDKIRGTKSHDDIHGFGGNDFLYGRKGRDHLWGGDGNDRLKGGRDDDILDGGAGWDRLFGGHGNDLLIYRAAEESHRQTDFYDGGHGFDTLIVELEAARYTEEVRLDLLDFLSTPSFGKFTFATLNLQVRRIETVILRVDGVEVDLSIPLGDGTTNAVDDRFGIGEDAQLNASVSANDSPASGGTVRLLSGVSKGLLILNSDGSFSYDASGFDNLAVGQIATQSFTYELEAGGRTDTASVTLTITGTNDGATITIDTGGDRDVTEDLDTSAGGSLTIADPDDGEAEIDPTSATAAHYGSFSITAEGAWNYTLDHSMLAVQALPAGATLTDSITVASLDGAAEATIAISITGTNDAPQLASALGPQQAKAGVPFLLAAPATNFVDPDIGDALTLSASLQNGDPLPGWLGFDPDTGLFSGTPAIGDAGAFAVALFAADEAGETATDLVTFAVAAGDPPAVATLALAAVDGNGEGATTAARVTLVGTADAGDRVRLFDAEGTTQIGTTIANNQGQFRFTGVGFDLGENAFEVETVDVATGLSTRSADQVFVRLDDAEAPANAALYWTQVALDAVAESGSSPNFAARAMAMEAQAVFNAIAAIEGTAGYEFNVAAAEGASLEAAIAQAAYIVLAQVFPSQRGALDTALEARLAGITEGLSEGLDLGAVVAQRVLDIRDGDGWNLSVTDIGQDVDGIWRPTGPGFRPGADAHWGDVDPFVVDDVEAFRPAAPPSLLSDTVTDDAYASDLARTLELGRANSSARTADQSEIARFWQDGVGTTTPGGHWTAIGAQIAAAEGLSLSETANLMLQLNLAMADAGIAAFDTKYAYDVWRPITVAREGGTIDGTQVDPLPGWQPFVNTPNHPEYVSGHSSYSGAGAAVLTHFFGDAYDFSTSTTSIATPTIRTFDSFWDAAQEAGESRIYGGIHWEFSNVTGQQLGAAIAQAVITAFNTEDDVIAPRVFISQEGGGALQAPVFSGFVIDNLSGVDSFRVSIDGGDYLDVALDGNGNFVIDSALATDGSADGIHQLEFIASDASGNLNVNGFDFVLAAGVPDFVLSGDLADGTADADTRLTGEVDYTVGARLVSLSYALDGGDDLAIAFARAPGKASFDTDLDMGDLLAGNHTLTLTAVDGFGTSTTETVAFTLAADPLLSVTNVSIATGETGVALTFRPLIEFSTAVDVATLTTDNIVVLDGKGNALGMTITPLDDGTGAWVFFDAPLPGATALTLIADGDAITTPDGRALDGNGDGVAGGALVRSFTTLSNSPVEGTTLVGKIQDPGADYQPMTTDDFLASANGATDWDGHTYLNPLSHVKVYILGREDEAVFTDENGYFELTSVPGGTVKLAVDGRTADNAPDGFFFPEMVMDVQITAGVENTVMGGIGSRDQKLANIGNEAVYLPRIDEGILVDIANEGVTTVVATTDNGSALTSDELGRISMSVTGGSLVDENGNPIENAQLGISTVPPELVRDMLPDGILQHTFDITIQAPGGAVFTEEAQISFPNVFNMAPGERTFILSFDHTTGQIVIDGTATVSADGLTVVSDPGSGIDQPGWHGLTPPGAGFGGYGPPPPCPPASGAGPTLTPADVVNDIAETSGDIGQVLKATGLDDTLGGEINSGIGLVSSLTDFKNDSQNTLNDIFNGLNGDASSLGGEPDAAFFAIKGLELLGQTAKAGFALGKEGLNFVPGYKGSPAEKTIEALDTTIAVAEKFGEISAGGDGLPGTKTAQAARDLLTSPPPPKPAAGSPPGSPPPPEPDAEQQVELQELEDAVEQFEEKAQELKDLIEEQKPIYEQLSEKAQQLKDHLDPPGGDGPLDPADITDLIDTDPDTGEFTSDFGDDLIEFFDFGIALGETGALEVVYEEYLVLYQRVLDEYSDIIADDPPKLGENPHGPGNSVEGGYVYNHTLYGAARDIETGEVTRFAFASGEQWSVILTPEKTYELMFLDPASGYISTSLVEAGLAGTSQTPQLVCVEYAAQIRTAGSPIVSRPPVCLRFEEQGGVQPPVLLPDDSPVLANGLTAIASMIVGANPNISDSLLPGTGISDAEALLSGAADAPLLISQQGPVANVELLGLANAVDLAGTGNNGGGLIAYVATGAAGLAIVDVSNPQNPVIMAQLDLEGIAVDVVASENGRRVAVATGDAVAVIDVSNPLVPTLAYTLDNASSQVQLIGDNLVVAQGAQIALHDLASGAIVQQLTPFAASIAALHWDGDRLVALTTDSQAHILTVDVSGTLVVRGTVAAPRAELGPEGIATDGDLLLIGARTNNGTIEGFSTFAISDPDAPVRLATASSTILTDALVTNGSGLGVAAGTVVTFGTDPLLLTVFGSRAGTDAGAFINAYALDYVATDVEIAGRYAFVTGGSGLNIVAYAPFDTAGIAPTITITQQPEDLDPATPGLQLLEGSLARFGIEVSDDVLVRNVQLLVNGEIVASDISFNWSLKDFLPTISGNAGDPDITVELRAVDTGGNIGTTGPIAVELVADATPLAVVAIRPDAGAPLAEGRNYVAIEFSKALDPTFVAADRFSLTGPDGLVITPVVTQLLANDTQVRLAFDIATIEPGTYVFGIDADSIFDRFGNALGETPLSVDYGVSDASATWISPISGTWSTPANWAAGLVPGEADDVLVAPVAGTTAEVASNVGSVNSLEVRGPGDFHVGPAGISGYIEMGTLLNNGNFSIGTPGGGPIASLVAIPSGFGQVTVRGLTTNLAHLAINNGSLRAEGDIFNPGTIDVSSLLSPVNTDTVLAGGGTIELVDGGDVIGAMFNVEFGVFTHKLTNIDNTITGTGSFGQSFEFVAEAGGQVVARDGDALTLASGRTDNNAVFEAQAGGFLIIESNQFYYGGVLFAFRGPGVVENEHGRIEANGGYVLLTDSTIRGGYVGSSNVGGIFGQVLLGNATLSGVASAITLDGYFFGDAYARIEGAITNLGTLDIAVPGNDYDSELVLNNFTSLTGGGTIRLGSYLGVDPDSGADKMYYGRISSEIFSEDIVEELDPDTGEVINEAIVASYGYQLNNVDNTIEGSGWIGANPSSEDYGDFPNYAEIPDITVVNEAGGTITAQNGDMLNFNHGTLINQGVLSSYNGGTLNFMDTPVVNEGFVFLFDATLQTDSYFANSGDMVIDTATADFGFYLDNSGRITISNGGSVSVGGLLRSGGDIVIDGGSLTLSDAADQNVYANGGAADLVLATSETVSGTVKTGSLDGFLWDFGSDDSISFEYLDFADGITLQYLGGANGGTLLLDDGEDFVSINLGYFAPTALGDADPEAHFSLEETAEGGTILTIDIDPASPGLFAPLAIAPVRALPSVEALGATTTSVATVLDGMRSAAPFALEGLPDLPDRDLFLPDADLLA